MDGVAVKKQLARTFDDFGRKLTETDPNGKTWKWTWNLHNQLVSSQTPAQIAANQATVYSYGVRTSPGETQGLLKSRTAPGAQSASYTRDALGFVTRAETRDGSNTLVVAYSYSYDPAKRLASVTDSRSNKTLTYTWTPGGRLAQVQDSDGHVASFSYDATGRIAAVIAPNGETIAFTWDAGGRLVEQRLNSGMRTTQTWFEDGSLKQKQNLFNTSILSSHLYSLDQQGRRATQAENIGGVTKTWAYLYDKLDRLTSASDGSAETYGYDIWGNRRTKTTGATTTAYLYDNAHQLTEIRSGGDTGTLTGAAVHDADGHMTKLCEGGTVSKTATDCSATGTGATTLALAWNALEHLNTATRTGVGAVAESYQYDDSGRRISKTSGSITTSYLYNGDDIHAEWTGSISGNPAAAYVHGAGIDEPLLRLTGTTNSPSATQAAYLQDGLGSVIGTTNVTGTLTANQRFDAWGNKTASTGTTPTYGFTGREPDATGLTFYRARYQHPGLGRFVSRDPMGMADAVSPYAYVGNDPVNLIDPLGLLASLSGTPMNPAYWGMLADAGSWLSGARQSLSDAWQASPAVATGNAFAGLATVAVGKVTGNEALANAGMEGLSENRQSSIDALLILGTMGRSGKISGAPPIKPGSTGGATAGQPFPKSVRDAAKAENPTATCVYCLREGTATQVDHAIPRARDGNATLDNAQLACPHCNPSKGAGDFPKTPPPDYVGSWPPKHW